MTASPPQNGSPKPPASGAPKRPTPPIVQFFKDPSKPLGVRIGVALILCCFVLYPFVNHKRSTQKEPPPLTADDEQSKGSMVDSTPDPLPADEEAAVPKNNGPTDADTEANVDESEPLKPSPAMEALERATYGTPKVEKPFNPILKQITGLFPAPVALLSPYKKDDVWAVTINEVVEFRDGAPERAARKLDNAAYDELFSADMPVLTAAATTVGGNFYFGTRNGQLLQYSNYDWKVVIEANRYVDGRIRALASLGDNLFIGGKGVWKWNKPSGKLTRYPGFSEAKVSGFHVSRDNRLFLATDKAIWSFTDRGWTEFWKFSASDRSVRAMFWHPTRGLYVGTEDGIALISSAGVLVERYLPGSIVTAIIEGSGETLWAGTQQHGLKYWSGGSWFQASVDEGLPAANVQSLLVDGKGMLWMALVGKGFFIAPEDKVAAWVQTKPDTSRVESASDPKFYNTACKASEAELKAQNRTVSGGIAVAEIDGTAITFFDGKPVCPARMIAFRRDDGTVVMLNGWTALFHSPAGRTELEIPKEAYDAGDVQVVFLDSKQRLWLGSSGQGLAMHDGTNWNFYKDKPELVNNPVSAITEDRAGTIWVGTVPPFQKDTQSYLQPNLHSFDGNEWQHYSPLDNLGQWNVSGIVVLNEGSFLKDGGIVVGNRAGISFVNRKKGIVNLGIKEGFQSPTVAALTKDSNGNIWMSHLFFGPGITWFDGLAFHPLTKADGILSDQIRHIGVDHLNRIWLIGSDGEVGIYPRSMFEVLAKDDPVGKAQAALKRLERGTF